MCCGKERVLSHSWCLWGWRDSLDGLSWAYLRVSYSRWEMTGSWPHPKTLYRIPSAVRQSTSKQWFLLPGGLVAGSDGCTILTGSEPNSIEIVFVSSSYNLIYCTFTTLTLVTAKTFHHPFKPACSLLFSSFPHSPLFQTVQSKYLKFSSFTSAFCNLPVPLHSLSFTYRSSVYEFLHYSPLSGL